MHKRENEKADCATPTHASIRIHILLHAAAARRPLRKRNRPKLALYIVSNGFEKTIKSSSDIVYQRTRFEKTIKIVGRSLGETTQKQPRHNITWWHAYVVRNASTVAGMARRAIGYCTRVSRHQPCLDNLRRWYHLQSNCPSPSIISGETNTFLKLSPPAGPYKKSPVIFYYCCHPQGLTKTANGVFCWCCRPHSPTRSANSDFSKFSPPARPYKNCKQWFLSKKNKSTTSSPEMMSLVRKTEKSWGGIIFSLLKEALILGSPTLHIRQQELF